MTHPLISRLTLLRVRSGWTQVAMADQLHITKAALSQIENGKRIPGVLVLEAYAQALGCELTVSRKSQGFPPLGQGRNFRGISRKFHAAMRDRVTT